MESAALIECGGYFWPDPLGPDAERFIRQQEITAAHYVSRCKRLRRDVVVCAGGNVGIMPRVYAQHFERVITFEPDPRNYECLVRNTFRFGNVTCLPYGLDKQPGIARICHDEKNCGASFVSRDGYEVAMTRLDDVYVGYGRLDLLQLDVEGMEFHVLQGAEKSIMDWHPVIIVEVKHGERYGWIHAHLIEWLQERHYFEESTHGNDFIYRYNKV